METKVIPVDVGAIGTIKGMVKKARKYQREIHRQRPKRSVCCDLHKSRAQCRNRMNDLND